MKAHIKLGRIFGVAIGLHYSWIIIALLVTLSLRAQFAMEHPNWNGSTTWSIAIITGLLFFVSILLHELSHAAVAKLRGIPVRAITLFALGGVAQIEKDAADAKSEFWMGIIGPITSIVIGVVCVVLELLLCCIFYSFQKYHSGLMFFCFVVSCSSGLKLSIYCLCVWCSIFGGVFSCIFFF